MLSTLKRYFGYDTFRPLQEEIVSHILSRQDCLVLMPTGGGKSLCYQIPALMMEGTAIVVSPLISLMKDQVETLRANGIAAAALNSNASDVENRSIVARAMRGEYKLLYMSPEKLLAEMEWGILRSSAEGGLSEMLRVSLFAIDEAHCISQWGHDFRLEYTQLGRIRELFPGVPIAAFTATADRVTRDDIVKQLRLTPSTSGQPRIFVSSFARPNLSLDVRRGYSSAERLRHLLSLIASHRGESGIVYCTSRKTTESLVAKLVAKGVRARAYHAGLSPLERDSVQEAFASDEIQVVCATVAFGMGIDKSNVRFVVHYNLPKTIENYYQEIGRGGRDGLPCETVLYYQVGDLIMLRKFAEESGQKMVNHEKLRRMQQYAESLVCRRRILLNYFGETTDHDCANCDVCRNRPQRFDGTVLVQKALSAVVRTKEQIGFTLLIDILRGAATQEVFQKGYHLVRTYGSGRDVSYKDWQDYLLQMLHLGFIDIDYRNSSHIKVTPLGEDVLYGRSTAELAVILREDFTVKGRQKRQREQQMLKFETENQTEDAVLFEKLRQLRIQLATQQKVPPYVIFNDRTLHALATVQPTTILQFGGVHGIGTHKQATLGATFVNVIRQHKGLPTEENDKIHRQPEHSDAVSQEMPTEQSYMAQQKTLFPQAYEPWTEEEESALLSMYRAGISIKEISAILQRNEGAVHSRIRKLEEQED